MKYSNEPLDRNRLLADDLTELTRLCGGDADKARLIQSILRRSYRNEREGDYKPRKHGLTVIAGELTLVVRKRKAG